MRPMVSDIAINTTFILVLGHESSGTRLVANTLAHATGYAYDDGEHRTNERGELVDTYLTKEVQGWWERPKEVVLDGPRICRRSLPHGGADTNELRKRLGDSAAPRSFPDPIPLLEGLEQAGYDVHVVLTVRDRDVAVRSKAREHTRGDVGAAEAEMDEAVAVMTRVLDSHVKTFVFSYEALMTLGAPYLQQLYRFVGIESGYIPPLKSGNGKYLQPLRSLAGRVTKIGLVTRPDDHKWGGDLRALRSVKEGLESQGLLVIMGRTPSDLLHCDFVFLSNTCDDQRANAQILKQHKVPYALIGFHEDFSTYYGACSGFVEYVSGALQNLEDEGVPFRIEDLWANPRLMDYYAHPVPKNILYNIPVMREAVFCLAASQKEAQTMKRDCPGCKAEAVLWNIPLLSHRRDYSDVFLKLVGLTRGDYILQVGRMETRKNQLASALATKNLDIPLVFVATRGHQQWYELLLVNAAAKHRRAPTIIVSQEHPTQHIGGQCRIVQMPGGTPLSEECIASAYQNCGLHLHPAFWESPGYTYLEAAKAGVPTVASEWGTIQDYCAFGGNDIGMKDRFTYVCPYDLPEIERAVQQTFGRKVDPDYSHPLFDRTEKDVGKEITQILARHLERVTA